MRISYYFNQMIYIYGPRNDVVISKRQAISEDIIRMGKYVGLGPISQSDPSLPFNLHVRKHLITQVLGSTYVDDLN